MSIGYFDKFSVDDVICFVHNNPQGDMPPRYFFVGGSAVRLHQECNASLQKTYASSLENRPISDFDIMAYPGTISSADTFQIDSDLSFDWSAGVPEYMISSLSCKRTPIFVASPALTIGTKLMMTDAPRKKDYEDYLRLESLLDTDELSEVFKRASHIKDPKTATSLYERMASSEGVFQENYFRCLREATNIVSKHPQARPAIEYCFGDEDMDSTMISRVVLYHMNTLLDEAGSSPYSSELAMQYAEFCRGRNPIELDRALSQDLLSKTKTWLQELQSKNH